MQAQLTIAERFRTVVVFAAAALAAGVFLYGGSSRELACADTASGSWFHLEYCVQRIDVTAQSPERAQPEAPLTSAYAAID